MSQTDSPQCVINGATRLYAIVGEPITQVKSPETFNPLFLKANRNAVLVPCLVPSENFEHTVRGLMALGNLDGIIITVPYKIRALTLANVLGTDGRLAGAINALRKEADGRWTGDMFDGKGLVVGLKTQGVGIEGKRVALLGAGGAGSAIAVAFAQAGVTSILLHDIDNGKARALAERISGNFPTCRIGLGPPDLGSADVLINATPAGMRPDDPMPLVSLELRPSLIVIDIVTKPEVTPLLALANSSGCQTFGGRVMLEGQAEEMMRFFTDEKSFGK